MLDTINGIDQLPSGHGVYMVFNRHTGRIYVGQSSSLRKRCCGHLAALRRGDHLNYKMQRDATAHGADKFCFVALSGDSELDMIDTVGAADLDHGYNLSDRDGWTRETSFLEHEARLAKKGAYCLLLGVDKRTPVLWSMVAAWSRGMVGVSEQRRSEPLREVGA